jgi:hypothetical protein
LKKRDDDEYGIWEQGPYDEYGICVPEPYGADLYGAYVQYGQYKATVHIDYISQFVSEASWRVWLSGVAESGCGGKCA